MTARAPLALALVAAFAAGARAGDDPARVLDLRVQRAGEAPVPLRTVLGGAPAIVSVLATWCLPCRAEVPVLNEAARRAGDAGVRVVALFVDVEPGRLERAAREWNVAGEIVRGAAPGQDGAVRGLVPHGLPATFWVRGERVRRSDALLERAAVDAFLRPPG